jgi:hypothetical protein
MTSSFGLGVEKPMPHASEGDRAGGLINRQGNIQFGKADD